MRDIGKLRCGAIASVEREEWKRREPSSLSRAGPEPPSVCFPSPTAVVPDDPAAHTEADASVFVPSATRVG